MPGDLLYRVDQQCRLLPHDPMITYTTPFLRTEAIKPPARSDASSASP